MVKRLPRVNESLEDTSVAETGIIIAIQQVITRSRMNAECSRAIFIIPVYSCGTWYTIARCAKNILIAASVFFIQGIR